MSGHSCCRWAYPNASGRCCLFGLDLVWALGSVILGQGGNFVGPQSLSVTMHSRAMHLLGGIVRRLHSLDPQFMLGCRSIIDSPWTAVLVQWRFVGVTRPWLLGCNKSQGSLIIDQAALRFDVLWVVFSCWFRCALCVCCNPWCNS
jgi:hypothetical protein